MKEAPNEQQDPQSEEASDILNGYTFDRTMKILDRAEKEPVEALYEVFSLCYPSSYTNCLNEWMILALSSQRDGIYEETSHRGRLVVFCKALNMLTEAAYIICCEMYPEASMFKNEITYSYLNEDLQQHPEQVFADFCHLFSEQHTRAELWYLMEAVICYVGIKKPELSSLPLYIEMLWSITVAARNYPRTIAENPINKNVLLT